MKENEGFVQVPNNVFDFLIDEKLTLTELRMLLLITRKTYGWKKDKAELSQSYISTRLRIAKRTAEKTIKSLKEKTIIETERNDVYRRGRLIQLNPRIETAKVRQITEQGGQESPNVEGENHRTGDPISKYNIIKENISKERDVKNVFLIPKYEEIEAYCIESNSKVDPKRFYDYYEQRDWKTGKTKMTDWKQALNFWEQRENTTTPVDNNEKHLEKIVEAVAIDTSDWGFEVLQEFKDILADFGDYPKFGDFGKAYLNYVKYLKLGEDHKQRALKVYQALDFYEKELKYEETDPKYYKSLENFFATSIDEYAEKRRLNNEAVLFCPGGSN